MAIAEGYRKQVALLIRAVPFIAPETEFALKGGTAINLFVRDLPRLSVDIDLTYVPVADRVASLNAIDAGMKRIADAITKGIRGVQINASQPKGENCTTKLIVRIDDAQSRSRSRQCCAAASTIPPSSESRPRLKSSSDTRKSPLVNFADLYAGKIMAALDRQHPRDLYRGAKDLPAVRWKLENLVKLSDAKRAELLNGLSEALGMKEAQQ